MEFSGTTKDSGWRHSPVPTLGSPGRGQASSAVGRAGDGACQCRRRAGPEQRRDLRGGHAGGVLTPAGHTQGGARASPTPLDAFRPGPGRQTSRRPCQPARGPTRPPAVRDRCWSWVFFSRLPTASLVIKTGLGQRFKGLAHHRLPFGALPQRGRAGPFDLELTQRPFAMALPTPTSSVSGPHPGPRPLSLPPGPWSRRHLRRTRLLHVPWQGQGPVRPTGGDGAVCVCASGSPGAPSCLLLDPETPPFASWGDSPHPTSSMKTLVAELYPFVHKAGTSC